MKKLFINGKFFSQRITGTQRYARELLNHFDQLLGQEPYRHFSIEVLAPRNARLVPSYSSLRVRTVGILRGTMWEQLELPWYCRGHLLFTLSGGAPMLHSRNVVTIHDAAVVAVPAGYALPYRLWHRAICRWMAQTSAHVFTDSQFSKLEIMKWYNAPQDKVSVHYLGSGHFSSLQADASALTRFGISGRYILAVSSYNPNKNFLRVIEAINRLHSIDAQLVLVGGTDDHIYRETMNLPIGVCSLGYVSDSELKALYQHAACFVFASLYEGFGLPPLEAMSSGCPVVLSRAASLPELFEGAAIFCDPYNPDDIASAISRALNAPLLTAQESETFAANFTWNRCAREVLDIIQSL